MENIELSDLEMRRYSRQIKLDELGVEGQQKLKSSKILVIGAGSIGTPALQYLTAAGVGLVGICDNDYVNETNFHRQIMYGASDLGKLKTIVAKEKLQLLNPLIKFDIANILISDENVINIIEPYDVILDCTNSSKTHSVLCQACKALNKPLVIGEVRKFEGRILSYNYQNEPQLPVFEKENIWCTKKADEIGIIGVISGIIGCMQADEALKAILPIGESLSGNELIINTFNNKFIINKL